MAPNISSWLKFVKRRALSLSLFILAGIVILAFPPYLYEWRPEGVNCGQYFLSRGLRGPLKAWRKKGVILHGDFAYGGGENLYLCVAEMQGHIGLYFVILGCGALLWKMGL